MEKYLIVAAGGSGTRMKSDIPKQFLLLANKPIILQTIQRFINAIPSINIIVVLPEQHIDQWNQIIRQYHFQHAHHIAIGGNTRTGSIHNGLKLIADKKGLIAIHDAARPLVSTKTILNAINTASVKGNAIPVVPIPESVRQITNDHNCSIDRSELVLVQTPQCFRIEDITKAYQQITPSQSFTDDASVAEAANFQINLTEGNPENIKITHVHDIIIAEALYPTIN